MAKSTKLVEVAKHKLGGAQMGSKYITDDDMHRVAKQLKPLLKKKYDGEAYIEEIIYSPTSRTYRGFDIMVESYRLYQYPTTVVIDDILDAKAVMKAVRESDSHLTLVRRNPWQGE